MNRVNHVGHNDRPDIAGEHPLGDIIQLIAFIIFLIVWITDSFYLKFSLFLADFIPVGMRLTIALLNIVGGILLARNGLREVFGEIRESPIVIKTGPFKYSRHPVYLGVILFYFGLVIITGSMTSAVLFIIITGFYYYISRHEEKLLIKKFGKEYLDYMNKVPMLIPKIPKKNKKMYIGILFLFHAIIFTIFLRVELLNKIGYLILIVGGIYLWQGIKLNRID